ncbi:hypothetical protein RHSIM_Rhsim05G0215400 [Rhododendron simsii]|uniref:Uncharacterized protein n=1 Tax=Rhododendron simsii TaxID=118357 RepID=A0A834H370_RHOSS|nr:hypothetical protein RHSIM_Rhsim05G0215400 [Rhododendron simsii]
MPQRVLHDIEQLLCAFLWAGPDLKCSSAKVAWHAVCAPKEEGGLGIHWLKTWNKASMLRHLWAICMKADTLWIKWIHTFVLKKHSLWRAKIPHDASWTVCKLLKLRDMAQPWIQYVIGDGKSTYLWADNWHNLGPLYKRFGDSRDFNVGRPLSAKVSSIIHNDEVLVAFKPRKEKYVAFDSEMNAEEVERFMSSVLNGALKFTRTHMICASISHVLLDASRHLSFVNSLDKSGVKSSNKVLIAFKPRKGKYEAFDGEMNAEELERFVGSVLNGDVKFTKTQ